MPSGLDLHHPPYLNLRANQMFYALALLARQIGLELRHLASQRFDFVFCPVSLNRSAFLKDTMFLAIARVLGVPVVLYGHGNNLPEFRNKSPRWLQRLIDWAVRGAAAATVLGKCLRFNFPGHLREDQVFVVPTEIEVPNPSPAATKPAGRFTVLYLGNPVREKGVFVILDALPLVRGRCPQAHFVFAGAWWSEKDGAEADRLVRERGLSSCVEFTGMVTGDRKWGIVTQGDVLVLPTYFRYETLGLVLLEAMGVGLPVITTRRAAIPEIVEEGISGLFVAEQDARDLADKIITLAGDPALRARMEPVGMARLESIVDLETISKERDRHNTRLVHSGRDKLRATPPGIRENRGKHWLAQTHHANPRTIRRRIPSHSPISATPANVIQLIVAPSRNDSGT